MTAGIKKNEQCAFIVQLFKILLLVLHKNFGKEAKRKFIFSELFK